MIYLPTIFIAFTISFILRNRNFNGFISLIIPLIGMIAVIVVYQFFYFGELDALIYFMLKIVVFGGLAGSLMGLFCFKLLNKKPSRINLKIVTIMSRLSIITIIMMIFSFGLWNHFQWEIEARRELPDTISLFAKVSFKEDLSEGFGGYYSRVFEFDFPKYQSSLNCEMTTKATLLEDDLFEKTGFPFKALDLIPTKENICVINNSNFANGRIIITRNTGVTFIVYYID